jgi:hypothetical protein
MKTTKETMTVTLDKRIEQIKEIIWTVGAYTPLPEELANIHKMIKTNDPALEETLNAFFGYDTEDDPELDNMFDEIFDESDDTEDSDDDMFLFDLLDEMFAALDNP